MTVLNTMVVWHLVGKGSASVCNFESYRICFCISVSDSEVIPRSSQPDTMSPEQQDWNIRASTGELLWSLIYYLYGLLFAGARAMAIIFQASYLVDPQPFSFAVKFTIIFMGVLEVIVNVIYTVCWCSYCLIENQK